MRGRKKRPGEGKGQDKAEGEEEEGTPGRGAREGAQAQEERKKEGTHLMTRLYP